jgi:hypothetical protein
MTGPAPCSVKGVGLTVMTARGKLRLPNDFGLRPDFTSRIVLRRGRLLKKLGQARSVEFKRRPIGIVVDARLLAESSLSGRQRQPETARIPCIYEKFA